MTIDEFKNYRKNHQTIRSSDEGADYEIHGLTTMNDHNYIILRRNEGLKAIPVELVDVDNEGQVGTNITLNDTPGFTEQEWENDRPALQNKLASYYRQTQPEITNELKNTSEDTHQGYEGSSQETGQPEGPDTEEGMDYDKATGNTDKYN